MRSASFRVLSTVIWLLLLVALASVIALVVRDNPPGSQSASTPSPRQTAAVDQTNSTVEESNIVQPTFTNTPSVAKLSDVPLLDTKRILAGGFSFRPLDGYTLETVDGSVTMTAGDAVPEIGPTLLLIGGADSPLIEAETESIEDAFDQFVNAFAEDGGFEIGEKITTTTKNLTGVSANLSNRSIGSDADGQPFAGRVFMSRATPPQFFVMLAIAPTSEWDSRVATEFDAVLNSISLFTLTSQFNATSSPISAGILNATQSSEEDTAPHTDGTPIALEIGPLETGAATPGETPSASSRAGSSESPALASDLLPTNNLTANSSGSGNNLPAPTGNSIDANENRWRSYTNGNFVNEAIVEDGIVWAATDGGVLAWDTDADATQKYTTINGLLANQSLAIARCDLSNLGLVVGTSSGLQIFNAESGRWSTLTSEKSLMSYDDVSDIYCDSNHEFMVLGYQRHGIDIFDFKSNEWLHFDRNRALVSNIVERLTVVGDRKEVWVVSDLGLTILENIPELDNRRSTFFDASNSDLQVGPINAIVRADDDSIWLAQDNVVYNIRRIDESVAGSTQREWSAYVGQEIGFPFTPIQSVTTDSGGSVWIASLGGEICRLDLNENECVETFAPSDLLADGPIEDVTISHLFTDEAGELYVATQGNGIKHYDGRRWLDLAEDEALLTTNRIEHLVQDSDGYIWVSTSEDIQLAEKSPEARGQTERLIRNPSATQRVSQGNREKFTTLEDGQQLSALWANTDGQIWLGTDEASVYDGNSWETYSSLNGLVGSPVQAYAMDAQNRVWIGTGGGLNILNEGSFFSLTTDQGLPNHDIRAIISGLDLTQNIVWIGTAGGGLLRFEKNQLQVFNQRSANLPSDNVLALGFDVDGSLLIGTDNGLARLVGGRAIKIRSVGDVSVTTIATIPTSADAATGSIWVGTAGQGVFHYNGLAWVPLPPENLPDPHITALLVDHDATVWIGGANGGLIQHTPVTANR